MYNKTHTACCACTCTSSKECESHPEIFIAVHSVSQIIFKSNPRGAVVPHQIGAIQDWPMYRWLKTRPYVDFTNRTSVWAHTFRCQKHNPSLKRKYTLNSPPVVKQTEVLPFIGWTQSQWIVNHAKYIIISDSTSMLYSVQVLRSVGFTVGK